MAHSIAACRRPAVPTVVTVLLFWTFACSGDPSNDGGPIHPGPLPEEPVYAEPGELFLVGGGIESFFQEDRGVIHMEDGAPLYGLGLMLDGTGVERLTARALGTDGVWTPFLPVEVTWSEGVAHVARVHLQAPAVTIELARNGARLAFAAIERLTEPPEQDGVLTRDLPFVEEEVVPKNLPGWMVTRAGWGARSRPVCGTVHTPRFLTVHHTATPNNDSLTPAARMRQMQAYHIDALGWCDFGYHYTVGIDGRVYEGRANHRRTGSHVGGHNTNNVGVSVVGNFVSFTPRQVQLDGLVQVSAWLVGQHAIPTTASGIRGHRDWPGHTSNACPGNRLHAWLPTLRSAVAAGGVVPPTCQNACTPGATRCQGGQVERCADFSNDGCTTWGGATACGCGEECISGACVRDPEVCCPAAVADATERFADVAAGSWAAPVAERLAELGITQGCRAAPPFFCPDCRLTRGQAAAFLARALELETDAVAAPPTFEDVPGDHGFHGAIEALAAAGIVSGCSADPPRFCPDDLMTRAQAAAVLVRAAELEPVAAAAPVFADVAEGHWARAAIETLHRNCHLDGCSSEPLRFCPSDTITRAAFGLVLLRALDLAPELSGPCCRPGAVEGGEPRFVDMVAGTERASAALALADADVTSGCRASPPMFCGDCAVSRGQAAALLFRASGLESEAPDLPTFVDVPPDHRFFAEIEALAAAGRVSGCSADPLAFCPDAPLTRAQGAALLARSLDLEAADGTTPDFADVSDDAWFAGPLAALDAACIAEPCGGEPRRFCGGEPMNRGDLAVHIARAWQLGGFTNCLVGEAVPDAEEGDPTAGSGSGASGSGSAPGSGSGGDEGSRGEPSDERSDAGGEASASSPGSAGVADPSASGPGGPSAPAAGSDPGSGEAAGTSVAAAGSGASGASTSRDVVGSGGPPGSSDTGDAVADGVGSGGSTSSSGGGCSAAASSGGAPHALLMLAWLLAVGRGGRGRPWVRRG